MSPARLLALALLLLGGCVYYNAMYNTRRLAGSARKAEREGRRYEANNLWGQVITRAESLAARHPDSKYVDEAMVLKGIALARLGKCTDAVQPLTRISLHHEPETREEGALALGRCQLELNNPAAASLAFSGVLESSDSARRRQAHLNQARALRLMGRPVDALEALEGLEGPGVSEERLVALGAAGRKAETLALADTVLARNDSTRTWDSVISIVALSDPRTASALVDHLGARPNLPAEVRARRLYQDAERLELIDSARAAERYREAARVGARTDHGARARLEVLRQRLAALGTPGELTPVADSLRLLAARAPIHAQEAKLLLNTVVRVRGAADSSPPGVPRGDLRLFLAAEAARDTLSAPVLAAGLFRRVAEGWPDSPYAPKALLAGGMLDPVWGEAMRPLLQERYWASPYLAFLRGEEPAGYRALEDSMQAYAFAVAAAERRAAPPAARRPGQPPLVDDEREPRRNRRRPQPPPRPGLEP